MSPNALLTKELIYPHSGFGVRLLKMCNKKSAAVFIWHKKRAQMISWESSPWNTLGTIQKVWRECTLKWYGHSSLSVTENEQLKFMRYAIIFIDKRFKSNRSDMTLRHKIYHELFLIDIAISWFKKIVKIGRYEDLVSLIIEIYIKQQIKLLLLLLAHTGLFLWNHSVS